MSIAVSLEEMLCSSTIDSLGIGTPSQEATAKWGEPDGLATPKGLPEIWRYGPMQLHVASGRIVYIKFVVAAEGQEQPVVTDFQLTDPLNKQELQAITDRLSLKLEQDVRMLSYGTSTYVVGPSVRITLGTAMTVVEMGSYGVDERS